jgi:hypothetical protein
VDGKVDEKYSVYIADEMGLVEGRVVGERCCYVGVVVFGE